MARAFSSVGRASPLQGEGQKFESSNAQMKGIVKAVPFFIAFTYQLMKTLLEVGFQYALIIRKALFRGLRKLTKLR